jgi:hypothetical protein
MRMKAMKARALRGCEDARLRSRRVEAVPRLTGAAR